MMARVRAVIAASISTRRCWRSGVAVDEDGRGACGRDGFGGGEESVGGDDDFVARADAAGGERELNRRRAVRDADAKTRADVFGEGALERLDLAAEDEGRVSRTRAIAASTSVFIARYCA